jgi:hypothetical protein
MASLALLTDQDLEEALSEAVLRAIAARAGFIVAKPEYDRDGIDVVLCAGGSARPKIDVQLKASINARIVGQEVRYPLEVKNYDKLRGNSQTPRMLVLMRLPRSKTRWLSANEKQFVMNHCLYWLCLKDAPPTTNKKTKTVHIPRKNLLTVSELRRLMKRSQLGSLL